MEKKSFVEVSLGKVKMHVCDWPAKESTETWNCIYFLPQDVGFLTLRIYQRML